MSRQRAASSSRTLPRAAPPAQRATLQQVPYAPEPAWNSVARRHQRRCAWQSRLDPIRLVFIDEAWTKTDVPLCAAGSQGQRLRGFVLKGPMALLAPSTAQSTPKASTPIRAEPSPECGIADGENDEPSHSGIKQRPRRSRHFIHPMPARRARLILGETRHPSHPL